MTGSCVLFLSYSGALGGAERILLDCVQRLGRPALVACPPGPLAGATRAAGLRVAPLAERPLQLRAGPRAAVAHGAGLVGLARDLSTLASAGRLAAVVAWGMRAVLACAAVPRLGVPVLAVHNDLLPPGPVGRAVRAATGRCAGVAALSHAIARSAGAERRAAVLHPGVALDSFSPAPLPEAPRALWLGAIVPWKRPGLALEVAALMPELRLDIVGGPLPGDGHEPLAALRRRARRPDLHGRVHIGGPTGDPRPALAAASCLLHTADAEPYGLALVEALAAGRPVVAAAAAGPLEIVGDGGRLFAPGDAPAAARAVRDVLADPGAGAAARARAEAAFDARDSTARFAAALDGVLEP